MAVIRHVTNTGDPILGADGAPKVGATITFQLVDAAKRQPVVLFDAAAEGGDLIVGDLVTATTDVDGQFAVDLWPNNRGELATLYKVRLPDGVAGGPAKPFYIRVTEGEGDLTLLAAKTAMEALQPQTLSLFDALLANIISIVNTATAVATTTVNGLMAFADKAKLDRIYTAEAYTSLEAAVAAIGATKATLNFYTDQTLSENLAVPQTLELMPLNGAKILYGAYAVDYAGTTSRWPMAQVLEGTGPVTFSGMVDKIYGIWTGDTGTTLVEDIAAVDAKVPVTTSLDRAFAKSLPIGTLTPPAVFNDQLALPRYYDGDRAVYLRDPYDLIDFTLTPGIILNHYYIDYVNGADTNLGTSAGTGNAWKTLNKAQSAAVSPAVIHLMDEWVGYQNFADNTMNYSGMFKFVSGHSSGVTRIVAMRESYTKTTFAWTDEGGGVWSTSAATTTSTIFADLGFSMFDAKYTDGAGGAMPIPDVGSSAACIATPGSQYHDAANSKKWVHLLDGREPDPADKWIYSRTANNWQMIQNSDTGVILYEGLHFYANSGASSNAACRYRHITTATNNSKYGAKNCLAYGSSGNGFETYDAKIVVFSGCDARYNRSDNFNYHSFQTTGTKGEYMTVYEYNCKGGMSGYDSFTGQPTLGTSCNSSTCHDSIHIERMNCLHGGGNGATIADVNGCVSVAWNVSAGPSTGGNFKSCFWHDNYLAAGAANGMYLWGCSGHDGDDDTVRLLNNEAQGGGATGQVYVKYWRGQTDGSVTGTLKDWAGAAIE